MNTVTVELSDQALADLHAIQLKLREKWKGTPGLVDHEVTQAEAIRHALAACMTNDWSVADLMPEAKEGRTQ